MSVDREPGLKGATVVVVGNDRSLLFLEELVITTAGARVLPVNRPEDVEPLVEKIRPDVVLTDWMMPGMDGIEVIRKIRRYWEGTPAILTSCDHNGALYAKEERFSFLPKPFDIIDLLDKLNEALQPVQQVQ